MMKRIENSKIIYLSRFIFGFVRKNPLEKLDRKFINLFVIIFLSAIITALSPVALKFAIDNFNQSSSYAIKLTGILLAIYILSQGLSRILVDLQWSVYGRIEQILHRIIRLNSVKHISNLPVESLHKFSSGQLIQSINNGVRSVSIFMQSFLQTGLLIIFQVIGILLVVFTFYDPIFLFIIIFGILLYVYFFIKGNERISNKNKDVVESQNEVGAVLQSSLQYPESNKYLKSFKDYLEIIELNSKKNERAWISYYDTTIFSGFFTTSIFISTLGLVTFLSYKRLLLGIMTIGDFVLMITYVLQLVKPIEAIGQILRQIDQAKVLLDNFNKINSLSEEKDVWSGGGTSSNDLQSIRFEKVCFTYPLKNTPVLKNINFTANLGDKLAIVGSSGAGKSTIIKLISAFYENYDGCIYFDSKNIKTLTVDSVREQVSVISQDASIYNLSIWKNITIGTKFSKDDAVKVAKEVGIDNFIKNLPDGYETEAGEHGVKLSGGERQRLALARSLLRKSPIVLFDEPTSSLDFKTEKEIMDLIMNKFNDKIVIIIAHRLHSIIHANRIIVLDDGCIVEEGKYEELIDNNGLFSNLVSLIDSEKFKIKIGN